MAEQRDALTELVRASVGRGKRMSTRDFAAAAVDTETGWSPSKSLVAKIIGGQGYAITPHLVSAVATGLDLPREVIAAAAHLQTIGYTADELTDEAPATVLRILGREDEPGPKVRAVAERWEREE